MGVDLAARATLQYCSTKNSAAITEESVLKRWISNCPLTVPLYDVAGALWESSQSRQSLWWLEAIKEKWKVLNLRSDLAKPSWVSQRVVTQCRITM